MSDIFTPGALRKAVHATLEAAEAAIPEGHTQAILLEATSDAGVRALYVRRAGEQWRIAGEVAYRKGDGPRAGVAVKWSGQ